MIASKQADFVAPPAKEEWGGEELAGGAAPVTDWSADGAPASAAVPAAVPAAAQPAFQVPICPLCTCTCMPITKVLSVPQL